MPDDLEQKLKTIIAEVLEIPPETLDNEQQFNQLLLTIESVAMLEILVILERTYHIHIFENEIQELKAWRQLADLIRNKISAQPLPAKERNVG